MSEHAVRLPAPESPVLAVMADDALSLPAPSRLQQLQSLIDGPLALALNPPMHIANPAGSGH